MKGQTTLMDSKARNGKCTPEPEPALDNPKKKTAGKNPYLPKDYAERLERETKPKGKHKGSIIPDRCESVPVLGIGKAPGEFIVDTSKPGGETVKALFEAAGHTVVERSDGHADDAASYLNKLHGTGPIPRPSLWEHEQAVEDIKTLAGRITDMKGDFDILNGRLDAQASRIDAEVANRVKNREDVIALLDAQATRLDNHGARINAIAEGVKGMRSAVDGMLEVGCATEEHLGVIITKSYPDRKLHVGYREPSRPRRIWRRFVAFFA